MRTRILCLPPADTRTGLRRVSDLAFYLSDLAIERVYLPTIDADQADPTEPTGFEQGVVRLISPESTGDALLTDVDVIVAWDAPPSVEFDGHLVRIRGDDPVDDHRALLELGALLRNESNRETAASLAKLKALRARLGGDTRAYVVAAQSEPVDFTSGAVVIASNPQALNDVPPHVEELVLWAATPERYLDSPTRQAEPIPVAFEDPRTTVLVPSWAYGSFVRRWPDWADRIAGLPLDPSLRFASDLLSQFGVSKAKTAEGALLLPLAAYLSEEIVVIATGQVVGSDAEWGSALGAIERRGRRATVLGFPQQRELRRRRGGSLESPTSAAFQPEFLVLSVNPDLIDDLGHHAHFDSALSNAVEASGGLLVSLGSAGLSTTDSSTIPVFSHSTFGFATSQSRVFAESFEAQLRDALHQLSALYSGMPVRVVMYSAGLAHLISLIRVAAELNDARVSFFANLLRARNDILDIQASGKVTLESLMLRIALRTGPTVGVHTMADTRELGELLEELAGCRLPHWPMVGVTPLDDEEKARQPGNPAVVCYPATQIIKGLDMFVEFAEAATARKFDTPLRLVARDTGHQPEWTGRLEAAGVHLRTGILTAEEYSEFMRQADIVALPYHSRPFQIQTSGAFADAVTLRRPVVATRSTWAGGLVEEHGLGATFAEGDTEGFLRAVEDVVLDYALYQQRMRDFAPGWLRDNNAHALFRALLEAETDPDRRDPDANGLVLLEDLWDIYKAHGESVRRHGEESAALLQQFLINGSAQVERLETRLGDRDRAVERLQDRITATRAERDRTIERFQNRITATRTDRDRRLAELRSYIAKVEDRLARSAEALQQRDEELAALAEELNSRDERIKAILADYDRTKANLATRVETREKTIEHLKSAIEDRRAKAEATKEQYEKRIAVLKDGVTRRDAKLTELNRRPSVRLGNALRRLFRSDRQGDDLGR